MENRELIILDGGMGTMLQAAGLPVGQIPELWNCTQPEKVAKIQRKYVEAGSRVLYTNTFGVNRFKAAGCGCSVAELVEGGVSCARMAGGDRDVKVALDIGPLGQLLEPLGTLRFEDAYEAFREILVSGEQAGADFVIIETMSDLYEVKAAVLAAKENTHLPVWVTMTFEASGRTFLGTTVPAMGLTLSGLGVDAMGFNCSLGPEKLLPLIEELSHWTDRRHRRVSYDGRGICPGTGAGTEPWREYLRRLLRHHAGIYPRPFRHAERDAGSTQSSGSGGRLLGLKHGLL